MKKGKAIYVEGRIQTRSWEADGKKNYRTEIIADTFQFGASAPGAGGGGSSYDSGSRSSGDEPSQSAPRDSGEAIQYPDEEINPEDIPF
jgi:single-strand DNA-binding protein